MDDIRTNFNAHPRRERREEEKINSRWLAFRLNGSVKSHLIFNEKFIFYYKERLLHPYSVGIGSDLIFSIRLSAVWRQAERKNFFCITNSLFSWCITQTLLQNRRIQHPIVVRQLIQRLLDWTTSTIWSTSSNRVRSNRAAYSDLYFEITSSHRHISRIETFSDHRFAFTSPSRRFFILKSVDNILCGIAWAWESGSRR